MVRETEVRISVHFSGGKLHRICVYIIHIHVVNKIINSRTLSRLHRHYVVYKAVIYFTILSISIFKNALRIFLVLMLTVEPHYDEKQNLKPSITRISLSFSVFNLRY